MTYLAILDTSYILSISTLLAARVALQGVSQKFPIWAVRHKLRISELWSRGVWGSTLIGPQGDSGQSPRKFWLFDTHKAVELI